MNRLSLKVDYAFKKFFVDNPDLLIDFLNALLEEFNHFTIKSLKIMNPELPGDAIEDKNAILDIHAKDSENRTINIEMQAHEFAEFAKRSAFYAFRLYIQSIGKGKKHAEIPPVISVNLLDFNLFPGFVYHRCFRLLDIKDPAVSMMDDIEFHFIELGKMNTPNSDNPLSLWIEFIRNSETLSEAAMKTLEKKRPVFKKAHKALTEISKDSKTRLAYDRRKSAIFFYERTLEQKFEDGRAEGKLEGKLETAKAMLLEGEPLEKIARITGLSIKEISKIQPE